jgi:hypothetical protein
MAIEVAKQMNIQKVFLIASVKNKTELPFYFRLVGKLKLNKIFPVTLLKQPNFLAFWLFGASSKFEKKLLSNILKQTNTTFLYWAIDKIVNWENEYYLKNMVHIHGNNDKIFPIKNIVNAITIKDGGHFMTLTKPIEIIEIIKSKLA